MKYTVDKLIEYVEISIDHDDLADDEAWFSRTMREEILKALKKCQWIPIGEKMPDMYEEVIGCKKFGPGAIDLYTVGSPCWLVDLDSSNPIIAWMPLPKPYKESDYE